MQMVEITVPRVTMALAEIELVCVGQSFARGPISELARWLTKYHRLREQDNDVAYDPRLVLALDEGQPSDEQINDKMQRLIFLLEEVARNECIDDPESRAILCTTLSAWSRRLAGT